MSSDEQRVLDYTKDVISSVLCDVPAHLSEDDPQTARGARVIVAALQQAASAMRLPDVVISPIVRAAVHQHNNRRVSLSQLRSLQRVQQESQIRDTSNGSQELRTSSSGSTCPRHHITKNTKIIHLQGCSSCVRANTMCIGFLGKTCEFCRIRKSKCVYSHHSNLESPVVPYDSLSDKTPLTEVFALSRRFLKPKASIDEQSTTKYRLSSSSKFERRAIDDGLPEVPVQGSSKFLSNVPRISEIPIQEGRTGARVGNLSPEISTSAHSASHYDISFPLPVDLRENAVRLRIIDISKGSSHYKRIEQDCKGAHSLLTSAMQSRDLVGKACHQARFEADECKAFLRLLTGQMCRWQEKMFHIL